LSKVNLKKLPFIPPPTEPPTNLDWVLFVGLQAADIYTTYRGLKYDCVKEANPIFGERPDLNDLFEKKFIILAPALLYDYDTQQLTSKSMMGLNTFMTIIIVNNLHVLDRAKTSCKKR
jgi:hypothetical protein